MGSLRWVWQHGLGLHIPEDSGRFAALGGRHEICLLSHAYWVLEKGLVHLGCFLWGFFLGGGLRLMERRAQIRMELRFFRASGASGVMRMGSQEPVDSRAGETGLP